MVAPPGAGKRSAIKGHGSRCWLTPSRRGIVGPRSRTLGVSTTRLWATRFVAVRTSRCGVYSSGQDVQLKSWLRHMVYRAGAVGTRTDLIVIRTCSKNSQVFGRYDREEI